MIYLVLILIVSIMYIILKDYKNKFNYSLAIGLLGAAVIIISLILKISIAASNYEFINSPLYFLDYSLYLYIRRFIAI